MLAHVFDDGRAAHDADEPIKTDRKFPHALTVIDQDSIRHRRYPSE